MKDLKRLCPANWAKLLKLVEKQEKRIEFLETVKVFDNPSEASEIDPDFIRLQVGRVLIAFPRDKPEYFELIGDLLDMMQNSIRSEAK